MEEAGPSNVGDRRAHLLPGMDDIDPEGIDSIAADVVTVHTGDEHLTLVVVDEQAPQHPCGSVTVQWINGIKSRYYLC